MAETKHGFVDVENIEEQQNSNKSSKRNKIIAAVVLVAVIVAALVAYIILVESSADEPIELYITEVVTSNNLSYVDETLGSPDWIEIYNAGDADVSLQGFGISDVPILPYRYTFGDVTIGAGEYLVVFATPDMQTGQICIGFSLSKSGETIVLTDADGVIVQMLDVPELSEDKSWGISASGEYKYIANPTVGQDNSDITADSLAGFEWMIETSKVRINEIMPGASELIEGVAGDFAWVEVYNTSDETVNLANFYLSDNISNIKKWRFPDIDLAAHEYVVVYISGNDTYEKELHTNFSLSDSEATIYFTDGNIGISSETSWDKDIAANVSVGLDSAGDMKYYSVPTPSEENTTVAFDSYEHTQLKNGLVVNEILLDNAYSIMDEDGDRSAWIEFYNNSVRTVTLGDYYFSDSAGNPYKWQFPNIMIESGEYLVVFLSGKDKTGELLHTNFRVGDDETALIITDRVNMKELVFALDMSVKKNISYGSAGEGQWRYFGQPTPGAANTSKGFDEIASAGIFDIDGLYINEVSAVGEPKSGDLDWIELANGGGDNVNLGGYFLSDSLNEPYKWQIPDLSVGGNGYVVIYASSAAAEQSQGVAPFSVAASGETLLLSSPSGVLIDYFDTGVLSEGNSVGRLRGDEFGSRVFFTSDTKGKANADVYYTTYTEEPTFSVLGGYVDKSTVVQISCGDENAQIYYTTDGDKPTTSSTLYTGGIEIRESLPLRAIAVSPDKLDSPIITTNYLVEKRHDIAVLCISGDQGDIDYAYRVSEIFVKRESEAHFEYYEKGGEIGVEFPGSIRVAGAGTRSYPQKSLNIYLRGGYGQSSVTYPFFENYDITEFKSLSIRNSGQDVGYSCVRTAFAEMVVNGMMLDNPQQKPVAVYINGEYWGLYWLCENQNEDFYAARHDLDRDNIEMIKRNSYPLSGTSAEIKDVRYFARSHDMSNEENYQEFITMVDEDSIIDYIVAQTFVGNGDMFNQKYWRDMDYEVEWRLIFYDLDLALWSKSRNLFSSYFKKSGVPSADGSLTNMDITYALSRNAGWREKLIERYAYLLNTSLSQDSVVTLFNSMVNEIESEMPRQVDRFPYPRSLSSWKSEIHSLRAIVSARTAQSKKNLQSYFNLSNERMAELFPDDGY